MTTDVDKYVTLSMVRYVRAYIDFCAELKSQASEYWIEQRVHIKEDMFGTVDFAALLEEATVLHLVDLKYGKGVPVYPDTPQAKYYAIGILEELNLEIVKKLKRIRVTIFQPRINNTRTEDFTIKELIKFRKVLLEGGDRCDRSEEALLRGDFESVELNPGSHCGFCKARYRCRALYDFVTTKGPMKDSWLGFAKAHHSAVKRNQYITEQIGLLSKEELEEYSVWCDLATRTGYAVKDKLTSLAAGGEEFKTLKLVAGRSSRDWKDIKEAKKYLKETNVEMYKEVFISVAQAEKQTDIPGELIEKSYGKPVLVPIDDKREAIAETDKSNVDELFEVIE